MLTTYAVDVCANIPQNSRFRHHRREHGEHQWRAAVGQKGVVSSKSHRRSYSEMAPLNEIAGGILARQHTIQR
ncbi:hypothetical protein KCP70_24830 [Salmonella enterica subsp. enterica]|nr:hypothetical protein KCP70_24830 [Salmonella enterica subsp. enterica]